MKLLNQYWKQHPRTMRRKVLAEMAKKLKVSESYMASMCNGSRRIPEKYAVPLEKATGGAIRRQDIAPDLYE